MKNVNMKKYFPISRARIFINIVLMFSYIGGPYIVLMFSYILVPSLNFDGYLLDPPDSAVLSNSNSSIRRFLPCQRGWWADWRWKRIAHLQRRNSLWRQFLWQQCLCDLQRNGLQWQCLLDEWSPLLYSKLPFHHTWQRDLQWRQLVNRLQLRHNT